MSITPAPRTRLALISLLVGDADDLALQVVREGECVLVIGVAARVAPEIDGRRLGSTVIWLEVGFEEIDRLQTLAQVLTALRVEVEIGELGRAEVVKAQRLLRRVVAGKFLIVVRVSAV